MRARNIKPGFFDNEYLAGCDPLARLLFIGLWCAADRAGRLEDRPMRLKKQLLGYDNCDCDALLTQLATHGNEDGGLPFITRYAVDGKNFIQINNFSKHQCPHMREQESTIPPPEEGIISTVQAPDKHSASTVQESDKHGTSPSDSPFLNTDSPFLDTHTSCSGETDTVRLDKLSDSKPCPHKEIIDLYHEVLPELPKIRTWPEHRKKALKTRWNEDSSRQSLDWWRGFFLEKVKPSDFLCGRVNEWTASLDWIILPRNFAKVLDGFYVRDVKKNGTNGHHTETEAEREARLERYRSYANA